VPTKKTCKAIASASGERCKRAALTDGEYCKQHHKQIHPEADGVELKSIVHPGSLETLEVELPETMPVPAGAYGPAFSRYEIAKRIAHVLANSNLVPDEYRGRPNDVFVAINMGHEVGLGEFAAVQSIAVIEGKPCLYGDGLIGVVRASPKCMWIKETISDDGKIATCETQRRDDPQTISAAYSMDDAVQAGIHTKFNWKKHPKRMLQMRARAYCLRDAYPDLLKGLGVVEERQDHEDTPPPVTQYELPKAPGGEPAELRQPHDGLEQITLSDVERAMHQSDSMKDLLAAGEMAKSLTEQEQGTARVTYKKMRAALMDTGEAS
jgi:hypothetical protein